jgi:hypothetical protein
MRIYELLFLASLGRTTNAAHANLILLEYYEPGEPNNTPPSTGLRAGRPRGAATLLKRGIINYLQYLRIIHGIRTMSYNCKLAENYYKIKRNLSCLNLDVMII